MTSTYYPKRKNPSHVKRDDRLHQGMCSRNEASPMEPFVFRKHRVGGVWRSTATGLIYFGCAHGKVQHYRGEQVVEWGGLPHGGETPQNPSAQEAEVGGLIQGHPPLHIKLEASLGYIRPVTNVLTYGPSLYCLETENIP